MILINNYLKEKLKHVFCLNDGQARKTTMIKIFVEKLGFQTLEEDMI